MNPETLFEAPGAHERYSNPYSNPEAEWETLESQYSNPEAEWETLESQYGNPEYEYESLYSNPYSNQEHEYEYESLYSNPEGEWEDEGEYFSLKGAWKKLKKVGKALAPIAKKFAPKIAGSLVSMIPGVGPALAPLASKAAGVLLKEGEAEAEHLESQAFVSHEGEFEVNESELAQQVALTEFLAAQAAEAETESEAEAAIAASLPITISIMGGRRALRPVVPILSQANARVVSALRRRGPAGSDLLRMMPTIHRQTVGALRAASRAGQPITGPVALKTMSAVTNRVMNNGRTVARAVDRNIALKQRLSGPGRRRGPGSNGGGPRPGAAGGARRRPQRPTSAALRYR